MRQLEGVSEQQRRDSHTQLNKQNHFVFWGQIPQEEAPAKKLRLSKPSKSAALHIDLCKATNSTDALQYLLQFARKPVEVDSVEGVIRILLEHYYKV